MKMARMYYANQKDEKFVNQEEFAREIFGLSKITYGKYENGSLPLPQKHRATIESYLGMPLESFKFKTDSVPDEYTEKSRTKHRQRIAAICRAFIAKGIRKKKIGQILSINDKNLKRNYATHAERILNQELRLEDCLPNLAKLTFSVGKDTFCANPIFLFTGAGVELITIKDLNLLQQQGNPLENVPTNILMDEVNKRITK